MSKFSEAYYKNENKAIGIKKYKEELHYQKLVCPECQLAPIHIVKKQNTHYFASNRKSEHSKDCQHFSETIDNNQIKKLVNSEKTEDKKRLNFLIQSKLNSCKRLLLKDVEALATSSKNVDKKVQNDLSGKKNDNVSEYNRESIKRVHIKNLIRKKDELIDKHLVIYGMADINIGEEVIREDKKMGESYKSRTIYFYYKGNLSFSIFLTGNVLKYFESEKRNEGKNFATFEFLYRNDKYLNLRVSTTKNILFF